MEATQRRFARSEAPDGSARAPKSEATLAAQRRRHDGFDIRPLFRTRHLHEQIHYEVTPNSVTVGSNEVHAAVQQFGARQGAFGTTSRGSPIPWGHIPARPFLGLSDEDEQALIDIAEAAIERAFNGA